MPDEPPVYTRADFVVPDEPEERGRNGAVVPSVGALTLRADAEPPASKLLALCLAEKRFRQSWERSRTDIADRSPSGWDMALANGAIEAGWSDQEICDLLIASRRQHGDDLKLREDYYQRTITRARFISAPLEVLLGEDAGTESGRATRLAYLRGILDRPVVGLTRYPGPPDSYVLHTEDGHGLTIKSADQILSQVKFRHLWVQYTGRVLPTYKSFSWMGIAQALFDVVEDDVIADQTEDGRLQSWLEGYLSAHHTHTSIAHAAPYRLPFYEERRHGQLCVFGDSLYSYLVERRHEPLSPREMGSFLRKAGWSLISLGVQVEEAWTTRRVWLTPYDSRFGLTDGDASDAP